jgi:ElaB/YqjD/DUF883 family membrane-anchored ribosome-binding protein
MNELTDDTAKALPNPGRSGLEKVRDVVADQMQAAARTIDEQVRTEHVHNRTVVDWGMSVAERLDRWGEELRGFRVGESEARFRAMVARNPGKSLLAAGAAGLLLGLLLRRR